MDAAAATLSQKMIEIMGCVAAGVVATSQTLFAFLRSPKGRAALAHLAALLLPVVVWVDLEYVGAPALKRTLLPLALLSAVYDAALRFADRWEDAEKEKGTLAPTPAVPVVKNRAVERLIATVKANATIDEHFPFRRDEAAAGFTRDVAALRDEMAAQQKELDWTHGGPHTPLNMPVREFRALGMQRMGISPERWLETAKKAERMIQEDEERLLLFMGMDGRSTDADARESVAHAGRLRAERRNHALNMAETATRAERTAVADSPPPLVSSGGEWDRALHVMVAGLNAVTDEATWQKKNGCTGMEGEAQDMKERLERVVQEEEERLLHVAEQ